LIQLNLLQPLAIKQDLDVVQMVLILKQMVKEKIVHLDKKVLNLIVLQLNLDVAQMVKLKHLMLHVVTKMKFQQKL